MSDEKEFPSDLSIEARIVIIYYQTNLGSKIYL